MEGPRRNVGLARHGRKLALAGPVVTALFWVAYVSPGAALWTA